MELLNYYVTAREQTDQQCQTEASGSNTSPARSLRSSTEALLAGQKASPRENNKRICRFCSGNHGSDECRRYETVEERKQRRKGSCFVCMKQDHKVGECGLKRSCIFCCQVGNQYRSLFPKKFGAANREGVHLVEELFREEDSSVTENALLFSGEMV